MPSGQEFASRLRDETRRTLAAHLASFEGEFRTLQARLSTSLSSVEQLARRLEPVAEVDTSPLEKVLADALAGVSEESARSRGEENSFLAHFAHEMRRKETQEEILSLLLDGAHQHAPRVLLFVARGNQFIGWSSRGFDEETAQKLDQCTLGLPDSSLLREALEADGLATANDLSREAMLSRLLPDSVQGPWHAFPLKAIQRPVAVLLALAADGRVCDLESLCILMDLTGLCIENTALRILHEMRAATPAPAPAAAPVPVSGVTTSSPAAEPELAADAVAPPQVIAPPAQEMEAASGAQQPVECRVEEPQPVAEATVQEVPVVMEGAAAAVPAETVESVPAEAAPPVEEAAAEAQVEEAVQETGAAVAEETQAPLPEKAETPKTAVLREVQPLTEEEKLHADAKRFARLLATEIKLYNEQRVQEGRANRDIYVRLKRDIDRSRDMYEKRVSPSVTRKIDYFHDEIIRVLGDNDPSALGSDYPGPRVES